MVAGCNDVICRVLRTLLQWVLLRDVTEFLAAVWLGMRQVRNKKRRRKMEVTAADEQTFQELMNEILSMRSQHCADVQ